MKLCQRCNKELGKLNKSGIHTACMTSADKSKRLFDSYKKSEGQRGNADAWRETFLKATGKKDVSDAAMLLGLKAAPKTKQELDKARRKAMLKAHPDRGGSDELAAKVNKAYEDLLGII